MNAGEIKGVILAGGKGTRLQPLTYSIPKEMVPVCGKPLVQHAVELLRNADIRNIVVIVGVNKGALIDFLKDGKWLGIEVSYRFQEVQNGNAKAVYAAKSLVDRTFALTFGDEIIEPNDALVKELLEVHKREGAACTLGISPVLDDPKRHGIVRFGENGMLQEIVEKPHDAQLEKLKTGGAYYCSNGVFVFEPVVFGYIENLSPGVNGEYWVADAVKNMLRDGLKCMVVRHKGMHRDVGTFEALLEAEKELLNRQ